MEPADHESRLHVRQKLRVAQKHVAANKYDHFVGDLLFVHQSLAERLDMQRVGQVHQSSKDLHIDLDVPHFGQQHEK